MAARFDVGPAADLEPGQSLNVLTNEGRRDRCPEKEVMCVAFDQFPIRDISLRIGEHPIERCDVLLRIIDIDREAFASVVGLSSDDDRTAEQRRLETSGGREHAHRIAAFHERVAARGSSGPMIWTFAGSRSVRP